MFPDAVPRRLMSLSPTRQRVHKHPSRRILRAFDAAVEQLEPRRMLSVSPLPATVGTQPNGPLAGKITFVSGGHGFFWNGTTWTTGRGLTNGMVEDMGNQDQIAFYADYLLRS